MAINIENAHASIINNPTFQPFAGSALKNTIHHGSEGVFEQVLCRITGNLEIIQLSTSGLKKCIQWTMMQLKMMR